jgi:hypothetical protein
MKKTIVLTMTLLLMSWISFAQSNFGSAPVPTWAASQENTVPAPGQFAASLTGEGSRDVTDLECPPNSVYSQTPDGQDAWSYIGGYAFYDNVLTNPGTPVTSITWWMLEGYSVANLTFDIIIRPDNAGEPNMGVTKYLFTNLTITGTNTGETSFGYPVYEFTYDFPAPLNIVAGDWIGIADFPDNGHHHYWSTSSDGDGQMYLPDGDYFENTDLAFCLAPLAYSCPVESIYSQVPDGLNGWWSINGAVIYDNILSSFIYPVTSITWWYMEYESIGNLTFDIIFRENNAGVPGNIIASFTNLTVPGTPTGTSINGYPVSTYTYTFPAPVDISYGDWVGIADYPDDFIHHFWCTSSDGDGAGYAIDPTAPENYPLPTDYAFCLSPAPLTPLSSWAIGIGVFLIVAFTVYRIRRF